ncbi:hypothetical protein [Asticcacaulis endophyticus]|uniref:Uncharacterized protein n=1 Tax=Asticcacaulis endophyticus TaxID=1395890 RepID=A0A918Q6P2_9CAUL|nr:hypothetical protein [Asticcacaulis endophyticus]GGZ32529.1 hypothetical protein GCM10011273_18360 [Asticcacaulis endophyticus]
MKDNAQTAVKLANAHGLSILDAMAVADGTMSLEFPLERKQDRMEGHVWGGKKANQALTLNPIWDIDPGHFWLYINDQTAQ